MKKMLIVTVALAIALAAGAQERKKVLFTLPDSIRNKEFKGSDSLMRFDYPKTDYRTMAPLPVRMGDSVTSVLAIPKNNLPKRIMVLDNNSLRLGPHFVISTGQAGGWGAFPDAYLDARTLSFPVPR